MKSILTSVSILTLTTASAFAGGIDRSGQGIGVLFESGGYVQLSFGNVNPSVSGSVAGGAVPSGDMAPSYNQFSLGVKTDVSDKMSLALILDQPFGANIDYPASAAPYPFAGTTAEISSQAVTAMLRYKFSDRLSVHGGVRHQTISGVASIPAVGGYTLDASSNSGIGYAIGAAFEIPDIALRAALTYNSEISHTMTGFEFGAIPTTFGITTPQSVNLEFQTGIAADTLLFGSVRWVDWSAFDVSPTNYPLNPLVSYSSDTVNYTLGVGRKFSDAFSGSISVGYEASGGTPVSNLGPTDGNWSVQLGGAYTTGNVKISGGVRYIKIGDATTSTIGADFADNSAIGVGLQIGYSF